MIFQVTAYLLAPFYLAALLWRGRGERGYWRGLGQRFGFGAPLAAPVWLHAASAGEVQAAAIVIAALRRQFPQLPLLVTATTVAGYARARALFAAEPVEVRYQPLDLPGAVRRFLRRVRPRLVIILETELWPNLLQACARRQVPVLFVSARLSARSAARYQRLGGPLRAVLSGVALVAAQTTADAQRFAALGVPTENIEVTGNLKTDLSIPPGVRDAGQALRGRLGPQRPVWIAGSTHEHEEQQVLAAHRLVRRSHPQALLVLVPRHPRRFGAVADGLQRERVNFVRQSQGAVVTPETQVLLVDAMGLLLDCYAAGDLAFVGGSLVAVGGHNLLEPAALGKPVLTGPLHANAREILAALQAAGGVQVVRDGDELGAAVTTLLGDPAARRDRGARALEVVVAGQGAASRVLALVTPFLTAAPEPGRP